MKPEEDKKAQEEITEFVITIFPKARFRRVAGKELTYELPMQVNQINIKNFSPSWMQILKN